MKRKLPLSLGIVLACSLLLGAAAPPIAKRELKVHEIHGDRREDFYYWLRRKTDPAVRAYLDAENTYADAVMQETSSLQQRLYDEMVARVAETDSTVPYLKRGYRYYSRWEKGKQYPIRCRRKDASSTPEEILLDVNALAAGHAFFSLGGTAVSDDGNLLAYTTSTTGFRLFTLRVKDLRTGKLLSDVAERVTSFAWAADNRTLFYVVETRDSKRPFRLYRQALGASSGDLVYEEKDERFRLSVDRTRSGRFLVSMSSSKLANETRLLPSADPRAAWVTVAARRDGHRYEVEHRGDELFIRSNDRGPDYRVVRAPVSSPGVENWREVIPHRLGVRIRTASAFAHHLVVLAREGGLSHITVLDLQTGESHRVQFPEPVYAISEGDNAEIETSKFRYEYESFVTPPSTYEYDLTTRRKTLLKRQQVPGYDPGKYASERVFATASDGTRIPVSLFYRKGLVRDGKAPLLLGGYGAYGSSKEPAFNSQWLSLLDRGVVCALGHVRGGGEMGETWYDQGKLLQKRNTFTDFIRVAEHLVAERYTSSDRLAIEGKSAGGLLMGAVTNMRPDLFKVVLANVPFVDVLTTMLDPTIPLTTEEYQEWGNPTRRQDYEYMRTYCPYSNLEAKDYPAMLVRASFDDSQVMYWEPAKYVAKLRSLKTDRNPLVFRTNFHGAHGGSSGRYESLRERAFDFAFVLWQLGVEPTRAASAGH